MGKFKSSLMPNLKDQAIKSALENRWDDAIDLNLQIIAEIPKDIDSLNRLAYAYMQSGKFDEAKTTYGQIIDLDKTNPIATKNLRKLSTLSTQKNGKSILNHHIHMDNVFIQEAGKTKTVELSNIADKKTLMTLQHGDDVTLAIKRSKIFVQSADKTFIGMLPDSIGIRLIAFMKGGNEYQACIQSVGDKSITIFIKEVKRAKKYTDQSSFS